MPNSIWDTSYVDTLLMAQCERIYGEGPGGVLYTPQATGTPIPIDGIFEAAASVVEVDGEIQVESRKPVLRVRKKRLDDAGIAPEHDDIVEVDGGRYRVVEHQPDGHAEVTLILMRAP